MKDLCRIASLSFVIAGVEIVHLKKCVSVVTGFTFIVIIKNCLFLQRFVGFLWGASCSGSNSI